MSLPQYCSPIVSACEQCEHLERLRCYADRGEQPCCTCLVLYAQRGQAWAQRGRKTIKNELRINQLSPDAFTWYQAYLQSVDEQDANAFGSFLADDAMFPIGNQPPVQGKPAIVAGLKQFWTTYSGEEHILHTILGTDTCFALEATNVFNRLDGKQVALPAVAITERNEHGLVTSFRVFIDIAPLYAPAADIA